MYAVTNTPPLPKKQSTKKCEMSCSEILIQFQLIFVISILNSLAIYV